MDRLKNKRRKDETLGSVVHRYLISKIFSRLFQAGHLQTTTRQTKLSTVQNNSENYMKKVGGGERYHTAKITASVVKIEPVGTGQISSLEMSSAEHHPEIGEENDWSQ